MIWLQGFYIIVSLCGVFSKYNNNYGVFIPDLYPCEDDLHPVTSISLSVSDNSYIEIGFQPNDTMQMIEHMLLYGCKDPDSNEPVCLNHKPLDSVAPISTKNFDIYSHPPRRPSPVYTQPTPYRSADECKKDKCLLPDCYCGGKYIPGNIPVEEVPQIVLFTFDDTVNQREYRLFQELFTKERKNPNGCSITATFYVSDTCDVIDSWTDYSLVQNLYAAGHEIASHSISHHFGENFSHTKWNEEIGGQRERLAAYGGVKLEDIRGMRAPFLSVGGDEMFKMLYEFNFTYDSSMPVFENNPPSWPYTLDYKMFHQCIIPPCPTKSYPGVWEVPMVTWHDLDGGLCSMGDDCASPPDAEGVYELMLKNFNRHYTTNRAPFGLFYHAIWFTKKTHYKEGFIKFLDAINKMKDVWIVTNWQALQWVRNPTPISRLDNFQPFQCDYHVPNCKLVETYNRLSGSYCYLPVNNPELYQQPVKPIPNTVYSYHPYTQSLTGRSKTVKPQLVICDAHKNKTVHRSSLDI